MIDLLELLFCLFYLFMARGIHMFVNVWCAL